VRDLRKAVLNYPSLGTAAHLSLPWPEVGERPS